MPRSESAAKSPRSTIRCRPALNAPGCLRSICKGRVHFASALGIARVATPAPAGAKSDRDGRTRSHAMGANALACAAWRGLPRACSGPAGKTSSRVASLPCLRSITLRFEISPLDACRTLPSSQGARPHGLRVLSECRGGYDAKPRRLRLLGGCLPRRSASTKCGSSKRPARSFHDLVVGGTQSPLLQSSIAAAAFADGGRYLLHQVHQIIRGRIHG